MLKNSLLALILLCLGSYHVVGGDNLKILEPSDLKPPCKITNAEQFASDIDFGYITLVDQNGSKLTFSCGADACYFVREDLSRFKSKPGSSEEQILLKIIKQAFEKTYDPALDKEATQAASPSHSYWVQRAVKFFIRALETRCATKSELGFH